MSSSGSHASSDMHSRAEAGEGVGVQVVCRLRPLNDREKTRGAIPVVTSSTANKEVTIVKGMGRMAARHTFRFDNVFGSFATQEEIFEQTLEPIVFDVLAGFQSTVFAYGQTGTGKTHTMEGNIDDDVEMGVIPRAAKSIFSQLNSEKYTSWTAKVSYLEIYNEELSDLLTPVGTKARIQICTSGDSTVCVGLSQVEVHSCEAVLDIIRQAQEKRQVAETKMNKASSRSHCLFTLTIESKERVDEGEISRVGKLHLCDLAGSECAKASDGNQTRLRESTNINKSLLTLGRVINAVKNNDTRVPYRDSKLTRLLQAALGGACKTCIIATVSPSALCADETLSTLHYADRAHGITNKAVSATVKMSMMAPNSPGAPKRSGCSAMGDDLGNVDTRTFKEMEMKIDYYEAQCEEAQNALARKHLLMEEATNRVAGLQARLQESAEAQEALEEATRKADTRAERLQEKVRARNIQLVKKSLVLNAHRITEAALHNQATSFARDLTSSRNEAVTLFEVVQNNAAIEQAKRVAAQAFSQTSTGLINDVRVSFADVAQATNSHVDDAMTFATATNTILAAHLKGTAEHVNQAVKLISGAEEQRSQDLVERQSNANNLGAQHVRSHRKEIDSMCNTATENRKQVGAKIMDLLDSVSAHITEESAEHMNQCAALDDTERQCQVAHEEQLQVLEAGGQDSTALLHEHVAGLTTIQQRLNQVTGAMKLERVVNENEQTNRIESAKSDLDTRTSALVDDLEQRRKQVETGKSTLVNGNAFEQVNRQLGVLKEQMEGTADSQQKHAAMLDQDLCGALSIRQHELGLQVKHAGELDETRSALNDKHATIITGFETQAKREEGILKIGDINKALNAQHETDLKTQQNESKAFLHAQQVLNAHETEVLAEGLEALQHGMRVVAQSKKVDETRTMVTQHVNLQNEIVRESRATAEKLLASHKLDSEALVKRVMQGVSNLLTQELAKMANSVQQSCDTLEEQAKRMSETAGALQQHTVAGLDEIDVLAEEWATSDNATSALMAGLNEHNNKRESDRVEFNVRNSEIAQELANTTMDWRDTNTQCETEVLTGVEATKDLHEQVSDTSMLVNEKVDALVAESSEWAASNSVATEELTKIRMGATERQNDAKEQWESVTGFAVHIEHQVAEWDLVNKQVVEHLADIGECVTHDTSVVKSQGKHVGTAIETIGLQHNALVENAATVDNDISTVTEDVKMFVAQHESGFRERVDTVFQKLMEMGKVRNEVLHTSVGKQRALLVATVPPRDAFLAASNVAVTELQSDVELALGGVKQSATSLSELVVDASSKSSEAWKSLCEEQSEQGQKLERGVAGQVVNVTSELDQARETSGAHSAEIETRGQTLVATVGSSVNAGQERAAQVEQAVETFGTVELEMNGAVEVSVNQPLHPAVSDVVGMTASEDELLKTFVVEDNAYDTADDEADDDDDEEGDDDVSQAGDNSDMLSQEEEEEVGVEGVLLSRDENSETDPMPSDLDDANESKGSSEKTKHDSSKSAGVSRIPVRTSRLRKPSKSTTVGSEATAGKGGAHRRRLSGVGSRVDGKEN